MRPLPKGEPKGPERRGKGRVRCDLLLSTLGEIVDLSASGLRVRTRGSQSLQINDVIYLKLSAPEEELLVKVQVVWTRRTGFRKHEVGMHFLNPSPQLQSKLIQIARVAADGRWLSAAGALSPDQL